MSRLGRTIQELRHSAANVQVRDLSTLFGRGKSKLVWYGGPPMSRLALSVVDKALNHTQTWTCTGKHLLGRRHRRPPSWRRDRERPTRPCWVFAIRFAEP